MRSGALGDFILTLPALHALRQKFPTHHLILAARADVLPLVRGTLADEVIPFDSPLLTPLFTPDAELPDALQAQFANTDLAVAWLPENSARIVANNLRRLDVARLISAPPPPLHRSGERHAADQLLDALAPLGIVLGSGAAEQWSAAEPINSPPLPRPSAPPLSLHVTLRALADEFWRAHRSPTPAQCAGRVVRRGSFNAHTRVVALHVGSGGAHKRWPLENFLTLAHRFALMDGVRVILVSGPAEADLIRPNVRISPAIAQLDSPNLSLLASILTRCALYIGNDSGVTHLAAALGVQTIALFGPTDPNIWGPRGAHVTILRSADGRMEGLDVETVWPVAYRLSQIADR